jgi:hypothetical protein
VLGYVGVALLAYVPVLRSAPGNVAADTKQYLYLEPGRMLGRAVTMWDPNIGMGTVTHQNIGYVFPMGPYYWLFDRAGIPDWVAQRLWLGSLMFAAGAGVLWLLRTFGLQGPGVVVAALAYMLTPYSLDYAARISVLLMPWAALPWMIGLVCKALRDGGWRYPALFALVVQVVGGVNATALLFAGIGPALWIVYSWLVARDVQWRRALGVAARTGALTILTSLWWIAGLSIQSGYGLNVLRYTETVEAVARTSTPNEVMRALGYWFFYGQDRLGPWIEAAENYTQRPVVIVAGYALAALALLSAGFVRWRHRPFFVGLLLVGVVVAVGAHPYGSPTPLGSVFKAFATGSTVGLAMRSTARAVPLVVLAVAVLLGVGSNAVYAALRRRARPVLAMGSVAVVVVLILVNFPALVDGSYYGDNLQRPEDVPEYWTDAARHLDARGDDTRVLELPGSDFASYRWGNTVDPITPGLIDRPYVARELIPWGGPATANFLNAVDRRIQLGLFDPNGFAPLARRMGIGDVVLRNDLQHERYDIVSARDVVRAFADVPGLGDPATFGPAVAPVLARPYEDERTLGAPAGEDPPAPVVVHPVENPTPIVRGTSTQRAVMLAGDGEGLIDASDLGLLDGAGIVQYSATYGSPEALRDALHDDTLLVVSDSNRRQARRWTSVRDNLGVTEQAGEDPIRTDPGDARLDVFPGDDDGARSTIDQQGVERATATSYGNVITYTPEDAAARALDGDLATAWRAGAFGAATGQKLRVVLDDPITTDRLNLVQPQTGARDRYITKVVLRFDGDETVDVRLEASSRGPSGQTIAFDRRTFRELEIQVTGVSGGERRLFGFANAVGFAEVRVGDDGTGVPVRVREVVRMPDDLLGAVGAAAVDHPLVVVMRRDRVVPIPPRHDPEPAIARTFGLPAARAFGLTGTARVTSEADGETLAQVLGEAEPPSGGIAADASAFLPGCVRCRPSSAIDGDLTTAWQTPFDEVRGQSAAFDLGTPLRFDHLDLSVIADGRHSVPTRIRIEADGEARELALPDVADQLHENATTHVPLDFPALTGRNVRITIVDIREAKTFNFYSQSSSVLPVGIAELGVPGRTRPGLDAAVPGECRDDLLTIDGAPVPLRITGATAAAESGAPLTIATCDANDPGAMPVVALDAGRHTVEAAPGTVTGVQLDRLALASQAGGAPLAVGDGRVTGLSATPPRAPEVTVVDDGRTRLRLHVEGADEPFWLVLGQSENAGWQASTGGAAVGDRTLVDGFANGWLVTPEERAFDVTLEWAPQRRVWLSLWCSLAGALLCVVIVAVTWWRRRAALALMAAPDPGEARTELHWPGDEGGAAWSPRVRWLVPLGVGVLGAVVAAPWIGVLAGVTVALAMRARIARLVLAVAPAALLLVIGTYMAFAQVRYRTPPVFEWPTVFPRARSLAWIALILAVGAVVADLARRRDGRRAEIGRGRGATPVA